MLLSQSNLLDSHLLAKLDFRSFVRIILQESIEIIFISSHKYSYVELLLTIKNRLEFRGIKKYDKYKKI